MGSHSKAAPFIVLPNLSTTSDFKLIVLSFYKHEDSEIENADSSEQQGAWFNTPDLIMEEKYKDL